MIVLRYFNPNIFLVGYLISQDCFTLNLGVLFFLSGSSWERAFMIENHIVHSFTALPMHFLQSQGIHGRMDGWMDGWMILTEELDKL